MAAGRPEKIGKYDVVEVIGRGGMGVVYKATDPHLGRLVAIKMMTGGFADNPDLLKRFYREAQSTGSLQHPNIVTVYELGDQDGNPYLVMEYLEGESLDSIISSRRPVNLVEKINFITEVCQGLSFAHHRGIVHRDIKPANVMVLRNGGIKIVDFGIAHIGDRTVTRTGQIMGSLSYMSPEQVNGKMVDTRTDLFSTGVVLYQLLTNNLPFEGETAAAILLKIVHEPPPPLKKFIPNCPNELQDILFRALTKDRNNRYQNADDLAFDLVHVREQLKRDLVDEQLRDAETLLSREEVYKAKELLLSVLKLDRQHTRAIQLLRGVQQRIQEVEVGDQVSELRMQAETAYAQEQFDSALNYVEKALNLHHTNTVLQDLRATIQHAKSRSEEVQRLLQQAESAYQEGDLDFAKQAIEQVLQLTPNNIQAKALYHVIHRDWIDRSRQRQLESLLESARKEIASRRFTAALDVLKEAEALDPDAPLVRSLMDSATAGREHERRRKELEAVNQAIEEALDHDDFGLACLKAEEGLQKFPDDRSLKKLKELAERQGQISERKRLIDAQLAQARSLMHAGRNDEAVALLEKAQQEIGKDAHLHSLLVMAREAIERERAERKKADYLQSAKECLRRKEFTEAIGKLEAAQAEFPEDVEIGDLLQFTSEEAATEERRKLSESSAEKARSLIENEEYETAIELLEEALQSIPDEELSIMLAQVQHAALEYKRKLEGALSSARRMLQGRKGADALKYLKAQPKSFERSPEFCALVQEAQLQADQLREIANAIERSQQLAEKNDFDAALLVLDACASATGKSSEIDNQLDLIGSRRSSAAAQTLEKVLADGRMLIMAKEYRAALATLKPVANLVPIVPPVLRTEFEKLQQRAASLLARQYKDRAEQLVSKGEHLQANSFVREALAEFPDDQGLLDVGKRLEEAIERRAQAEALLTEAQELFRNHSWKNGADSCTRAISADVHDPWIRKRAAELLVHAAESIVEKDWHAAEILLQQLSDPQPAVPVPNAIIGIRGRIDTARREESILRALNEAKRLQGMGNIQAAIAEVAQSLSSHPGDSRLAYLQESLEQLQREHEELTRTEQEHQRRLAFLNETRSRSSREPSLDGRIRIVEEALKTYPDEVSLRQELVEMSALRQRLTALLERAKTLEASSQYEEAIAAWTELRNLDSHFHEIDAAAERLRGLREQQRAMEKAAILDCIQKGFAGFDFDEVATLLSQARQKFPGDRQIAEAEKTLAESVRLRGKVLKSVEEARQLLGKNRWDQARELLHRCVESAGLDSMVRQRVLVTLLQGAEAAGAADWHFADAFLQQAIELEPGSPAVAKLRSDIENRKREKILRDCMSSSQAAESAGDLSGAITHIDEGLVAYPEEQELRQRRSALQSALQKANEALERQKSITRHLETAKQLSASGDLERALQEVSGALATFPEERRLKDLQETIQDQTRREEEKARLESARLRQEAAVQEASQRAEGEKVLENRVRILEEALAAFPQESRLQRELSVAQNLSKQVTSIVNGAGDLEAAKKYSEALAQWEFLRSAYSQYPGLDDNIQRLARLSEQARAAARATWLGRIKGALSAGDYAHASNICNQALQEFPEIAELVDLHNKLQEKIQLRTKGEKLIAEAKKRFSKRQWEKGTASLERACEIADHDPVIRGQAVGLFLHASESALPTNWQSAEMLLDRAARLHPSSPHLAPLRSQIEDRKDKSLIERYQSTALQIKAAGDRQAALRELDRGLLSYPNEPQILQLKAEIERELERERRQREQEQEQARQRELGRQRELEQKRRHELEKQQAKAQERERELARARELDVKRDQERERELHHKHQEEERRSEEEANRIAHLAAVTRKEPEPPRTTARRDRFFSRLYTPILFRNKVAIAGGVIFITLIGLGIRKIANRATTTRVTVEIDTHPQGASVRIKNLNLECNSPGCNLTLPPGKYELEARLQGYETATQSFSVTAPGPNSISVPMTPEIPTQAAAGKPSRSERPARLEIRGGPSAAEVVIDGASVGRVSDRGTFSGEVSPGNHQIKVLAKNQEPDIISRRFPSGGRVELNKRDFRLPIESRLPETSPNTLPTAEEADWQQVKDSRSISDVERYQKRYPNGVLRAEVASVLEDLYWVKATESNTAAAFREYLSRYPRGQYAQRAQGEIAKLDFLSVEDSKDAASLEEYLRRYPAGEYHDKAYFRLDDLMWENTGQGGNLESLQNYLHRFPNGRHAVQARNKVDELSHPAMAARVPDIPADGSRPPVPTVDDKKAILDVVKQYQKGYQDKQLDELKEIWPGMTQQQKKQLGLFFDSASAITLSYKIISDPEINGDEASIRFTQLIGYTMKGQSRTDKPIEIVMKLKRAQQSWQINSVK